MPYGRRSIRLRGFDYSGPGIYFVTICLEERWGAGHGHSTGTGTVPVLCRIIDGLVELNAFGAIVDQWWRALPGRFVGITLDEYVVMPDHFHGIIVIEGHRSLEVRSTLGQMLAWFKYNTTKEINAGRVTPGVRVWQRNYWERVIRDERELDNVRRYIRDNPVRWSGRRRDNAGDGMDGNVVP